MKLYVVCVGKMKSGPLKELSEDYSGRLSRFAQLEIREVAETKIPARSPSEADRKQAVAEEGEALLKKTAGNVYALSPDGKALTTPGWKELLDRIERDAQPASFVIGGAFGLSDGVRKRAVQTVSLSPATFTHELARVLVLEQLYRAWTLKKGVPYHY